MSLTTTLSNDNDTVTIRIEGRFDFNVHRDFRDAYKGAPKHDAHYVVDLSDTAYMDSSALGMLLLLREHGGGDAARVSIVNCGADIRKILTISNFHKLFEVS
jgi:anti-anti-sigma factor